MIALSVLVAMQSALPQQSPRGGLAFPPSTLNNPIYVKLPVTLEIVNMTPQVVADLVASGKIAVDGANHLNIPEALKIATLGPGMLRPDARADDIPKNSAEHPISIGAGSVLKILAPAKLSLVGAKARLTVQGNKLVITEIR